MTVTGRSFKSCALVAMTPRIWKTQQSTIIRNRWRTTLRRWWAYGQKERLDFQLLTKAKWWNGYLQRQRWVQSRRQRYHCHWEVSRRCMAWRKHRDGDACARPSKNFLSLGTCLKKGSEIIIEDVYLKPSQQTGAGCNRHYADEQRFSPIRLSKEEREGEEERRKRADLSQYQNQCLYEKLDI